METIKPEDVVDIIFSSVKKRLSLGKGYGTVIIAEGIIDKFNPDKVEELMNCPRDDMGRLRFAEVQLEDIIAKKLRERCAKEGVKIRFSTSSIGYELRCREPVPFDIEYCRLLGFGAVKYLLDGKREFMVVRDFDNLAYVPLQHMLEEETGILRTRKVDLSSDVYKVASSFMIK